MTKLWILFAPLCAAWLFSGSAMTYAQHEVTARLIETASNRNHAKQSRGQPFFGSSRSRWQAE